jgi:hypothetical protein
MNKERRNQIRMVIQKINSAMQALEIILEDERDSYDNIPDSLKESDKGEMSMEAQDNMESAIQALEEATAYLEEMC